VHPLPPLFFPPFVENGTVVREALRRARAREREREGPGGVSSLTRGWNRCRLLSSDYFAWHNEWVVFLTLFPLPLHLPLSYLSFPLFLSSSASGPLRVRLIKLGIQRWLPSPPLPPCFYSPLRGLLLSSSAFVMCGRRHKARLRHGIMDKRDDDERADKLQWRRTGARG